MNLPMNMNLVEESDEVIYVPALQFRRWIDRRTFPHLIRHGSLEGRCTVQPHPDQKQEYMMSEKLAHQLSITGNRRYHIVEQGQTLRIGPVVGIYTAGFTTSDTRPTGERSPMFAKMVTAASKMGITAYVFGSHHIDWQDRTINGYGFENNRWVQRDFPLPDVIYDRLPNRKTEMMATSIKTKERFVNEHGIDWFNPGFFDKWTIQQLLSEMDAVKNYLPETIIIPEERDIEDLLDRYGTVYMKPTNGSLGHGIQQLIKKDADPHYYCRFRTRAENRLRRYPNLKRLMKRQFPKGTRSYMAQRGIGLLHWNRHPIDFRVHTNKDKSGQWQVSALAAKRAGEGSVTTHVTSGGKVLTVQELFHEIGKPRAIVDGIHRAALELSAALSEQVDGLVGEIGFDLGVDTSGEIWMFEANSKPGRSIFKHPDLKGYDQWTLSLPFEYCLYLFEQSRTLTGPVVK